jgi:ABC-type transport system substrate-binding protein
MRRFGLSLLVLGAGVALLVSAALAGPRTETQRGGTLRLMFGAEPDSLDPALAISNAGSWTLLYATCAKLFNTRPDARLIPEVVRSWTVSNSGRTYTFELKRKFRFHNGEPVTAQSFADAFNRTANPQMSSAAVRRGFFAEITGAKAYEEGKAESISGVQVLARYRLRLRLDRKAGDLLARLTHPFFCPVLPRTPITPAGIDNPPGSGPYYIADHVRERRIVLERNRYFPAGVRVANPDRIIWTIERDAAERIRATERSENEFTWLFGYSDVVVHDLVDRYGVNRPGGQLLRLPSLVNYMFAFNTRSPAFEGASTAPLRKAISYALDRPALIQSHGWLQARRSDRLLPAGLSETRRLYPIGGPALVTAKKWLARAKQRPTTLTLYASSFGFGPANARVFASSLRPLGIDVRVELFSFPTLLRKLVTEGEPWDVAWIPHQAWYTDPAGALLPLLKDTRYEARVNAANRVTGAARARAWADLEADLMRNDPPAAVYADDTSLLLLSRSFGCFRWVPMYDVDLAAACRK